MDDTLPTASEFRRGELAARLHRASTTTSRLAVTLSAMIVPSIIAIIVILNLNLRNAELWAWAVGIVGACSFVVGFKLTGVAQSLKHSAEEVDGDEVMFNRSERSAIRGTSGYRGA